MFNATKLAAMALAGTQAVNVSSQTLTSLSATVNEGALAQSVLSLSESEDGDLVSDHGMLAQTDAQFGFGNALRGMQSWAS